jgi:hypothetical protein
MSVERLFVALTTTLTIAVGPLTTGVAVLVSGQVRVGDGRLHGRASRHEETTGRAGPQRGP